MKLRIYSLLIFFTTVPLLAANGDGGYAGAFLRIGMGARAKAMGDCHTALPTDAISGFYNPALLPHLENRSVTVSMSFMPLDRSLDYIGYAQSLQPGSEGGERPPLKAGFSLAWIRAGVDNIDGRDFSGNHTQMYSHSEHAFYLSFALSPAKSFSLGVSGKVIYNRFPEMDREENAVTSQGFGIDIGAFYTPFSSLMIGVVTRDNISKYSWNTDKVWERGTSITDHFPKIIRSAVAYTFPGEWLLASAEVETSDKQNPRYHVGAEFNLGDFGALRLGMDHDLPTFGLGISTRVFGHLTFLNYAFIASGDAPDPDHVFSWTFNL